MSAINISIIDYGVGNLHNLQRAFAHHGVAAHITEEPSDVPKADALVLPGVGAFAAGMEGLRIRKLIKPIKRHAKQGKPILGICLGAQLMLEKSSEFGLHKGLGLVPGCVEKLTPKIASKIPHIGWNQLSPGNEFVYFVHTFIPVPSRKKDIIATAEYGGQRFCAAFRRGSLVGYQFHPEKSGPAGLAMIKEFIDSIS